MVTTKAVSFKRGLAMQLRGLLWAERLYLRSFEGPSHPWSQANDWSWCRSKGMFIAAQQGSDLIKIFTLEFPVGFTICPICVMAGASTCLILLLFSFSVTLCIISWRIFLSVSAFIFHKCYIQKLFPNLCYHRLSIEPSVQII